MEWLKLLPCTSTELASQLGVTVRIANGRLQSAKKCGLVRRSASLVQPKQKKVGRWPAVWEEVKDDESLVSTPAA